MQNSTGKLDQIPRLLNERFSVAYYDGGVYASGEAPGNFDVENILVPTRDVFHCSDAGTKKNLVLKCTTDFTLTHLFIQAPKRRCSDPIRNCLVWVSDTMPNVETSRYYDDIPIDVINSKFADSEPSVVSTVRESLEGELEMRPWRQGRYIHLKFFDTHSSTQSNIDIAVLGIVGFIGRVSRDPQPVLGPWYKRSLTPRRSVHPHQLTATFSSRGWCCDGRDFSGGCRGGFNDFNETTIYDVSFRCTSCGFDLCEFCAADSSIGTVTKESGSGDLSRLRNERGDHRNVGGRRLAFTRVKTSLRTDPGALGEYLHGGILEILARFKYVSFRDAGLLLSQLVARLNPQRSASDIIFCVYDSSSATVRFITSTNAGAAFVDITDGTQCMYPKSCMVPVSNSVDRVIATAQLFSLLRGDYYTSDLEQLVLMADVTIPNADGQFLIDLARDCEDQRLAMAILSKSTGECVSSFDLEMVEEMTGAAPVPGTGSVSVGPSRKEWLSELRRCVMERLVVQLSQAETLDGDLIKSLILMEPEFTTEIRMLSLRLLHSGFAADVANAVRLLASVTATDTEGLAQFGAVVWAEKASKQLAAIKSSIDISSDLNKLRELVKDCNDPGIKLLQQVTGRFDETNEERLVKSLKDAESVEEKFTFLCEYLLLRDHLAVNKMITGTGFTQLTTPIQFRLSNIEVAMEPIASLQQLGKMVCFTQPIKDLNYILFCVELVGAVISLGTVTSFEICTDLLLGIHSVRLVTGESKKFLLANLDIDIASSHHEHAVEVPHASLKARLWFERLEDPSSVSSLAEIRPLLNVSNEVVIIDNPRSALHNILPLIGLVHSPRGWLVPPTGLEADVLEVLDSVFSGQSPATAASPRLSSSSAPISEDRVWSVGIQVGDLNEVPFELIWPMIREEIYESVRPYMSRSWPGGSGALARIEQSVSLGIRGPLSMGIIARGLLRDEAQSVSNRIAGIVQCVVIEDRDGAIAAETARLAPPSESLGGGPTASLGQRVKFNHMDSQSVGIVVSVHAGGTYDVIDEKSSILFTNVALRSPPPNLRDALRRRLVPALVQLRPPLEDPLLHAFTFNDHHGDEAIDDDVENEDQHHEEDHDEEEDDEDEEMTGSDVVVPPIGGGGLGNFFLSIGDFLSGIVSLGDGVGSSSSNTTEPIVRDIPGLSRGASLNAPIAERFTADDLLGPNRSTPESCLSDSVGHRVNVEVRVAEHNSEWMRINSETNLFPIILLWKDRNFLVPVGCSLEFRFVYERRVVPAGQSSSGVSVPHKRQRLLDSDDFSNDDEEVGSPRYSYASLPESLRSFHDALSVLARIDKHFLHSNPLFLLLKETLSRKLSNQLDQVGLLVAEALIRDNNGETSVLPDWIHILPQKISFLFPETLRLRLLQTTSLPASLTVNWIEQQRLGDLLNKRSQLQSDLNTESTSASDGRKMQALSQELSNVEERIGRSSFWLGCVKSCLAKLRKSNEPEFVQMSSFLLQRIAKSSSLVEIQFEGESGFGSAVTRSFFSELGKIFLRPAHECLWISSAVPTEQQEDFISIGKRGLRLRPRMDAVNESIIDKCRTLGRLIGRAIAEGYIIPLPISVELWSMIRDPSDPRPNAALPLPGDGTDGEFIGACARGDVKPSSLSDIGAVFVETGFSGCDLVESGSQVAVTESNFDFFIQTSMHFYLFKGINFQLAAIRQGISDVLPVDALLSLTAGELKTIVCGEDEIEWSESSLRDILHFHENISTSMQDWLIEALMELSNPQRATFLDFVTSCPRMPPGGSLRIDVFSETIASSNITSPVVRPSMPPPLVLDELSLSPSAASSGSLSPAQSAASQDDVQLEVVGYPRSRACVSHLYLPRYKAKQTLKERLIEAMVSSVHHDEITG